jgi:hypothetical protein
MLSSVPAGAQAVVPPASIPLGAFAAGAVGLVGFGVAAALAADKVVASPTNAGAVSAVHVGVLAFLTVVVLGAIHQFGPVVGRRPLRSAAAARVTLVLIVVAGWTLPTGFAHGPEWLIVAGGLTGLVGVLLGAWNLSGPLLARDGGVPVVGLRLALGYLVLTVTFGVVYAIDRQTGWFPLLPHRVLAHAHLGLVGWLGITYIAVAEKLWPMFLLAHRPSARSGAVAVAGTSTGTIVLATGLLFAERWLAVVGGFLVVSGVTAHLVSLAGAVRHRRRPLELLHGFVLASAAFLVVAVILGAMAGLADVSTATRRRLVTAEVAALIAWVTVAVVGHAHKIVPFISYTTLRARGVRTNPAGRPLLFADLYRPGPARLTIVLVAGGFAIALVGILIGSSSPVVAGACTWGLGGALAAWNLGAGPRRVLRAASAGGAARHTPEPMMEGALR